MNGIKFKIFCVSILLWFGFSSCQELNKFVEDVFVYEPSGTRISIAELKALPIDAIINDDVYVQGTVTSSDADGNFSRQLAFQDASGAIVLNMDIGSSNGVYPLGSRVSVQCKGLMLVNVEGHLQIAKSVSGEGLRREAQLMDNRMARAHVYNIGDGEAITPIQLELSQIDASSRSYEDQLVSLQNVFFQTALLPFANAGGSSEQLRTLYNSDGKSVLMCTRDASTMAGNILPQGKGTVTGILSYSNGIAQIMINSQSDISFQPSSDTEVHDPDDIESKLLISEYFSSKGMYYIELYNAGTETVNLSEYSLATDAHDNGVFSNVIPLNNNELAPSGIAVFRNSAANVITWNDTESSKWDPLRTNYSNVRLDNLSIDGNSQIALMKASKVVDLLSTTNKFDWANNKTLIRRPAITAHSKSSDFTRADAGWITKIVGYNYNIGHHKFFDSDPDMDSYVPAIQKEIIDVRAMDLGQIGVNIKITGRVISDRASHNVLGNELFMQDKSNRGICVRFRQGQNHTYDFGDEIDVDLFGTILEDQNGLLVVNNAMIARSAKTVAPNQNVNPIEASVSQIENLQSMYIFIKDVQIDAAQLGKTYGAGLIEAQDLFANKFYVATESTATFASSNVAQNSGIMKGIASISDGKLLLKPRNTADLAQLNQGRFTPVTATPISVAELRAMPQGSISGNVRVTCTVISDPTGMNNMASDKVFVQDASTGFILQLPSINKFEFGQSLIVVLKNAHVDKANGQFIVSTSSSSDVIAVGAPDPSLQPAEISATTISANLYRLVTITNMEVSEEDRLKTFGNSIRFRAKGLSNAINVISSSESQWFGNYIPTATGSVTGIITTLGTQLELYPRKSADLSQLPVSGSRINGEQVVYFVPSTAPNADMFISEAVMGNLDVNGKPLPTVARNNCNAKFVELYNPTANDLILSNYRVACIKYNNSVNRGDISYYQFPEGLKLTPGRTIVFKYISTALGTGNTTTMTNTIWPKGYTGDNSATDGSVTIKEDVVAGVILVSDARDKGKTIANSVASFPIFDGNDILVVQKSSDGGTSWVEIDRLFKLETKDGTIDGGAIYPYLSSYMRKPGKLGIPGNVTAVSDSDYSLLNAKKRNANDFNSTQCSPVGNPDWATLPANGFDDLGVHTFSIQ